mgnify:CR=1 FL=1
MAHLQRKTVMSKQTPDVVALSEVAEYLWTTRCAVYKLAYEGRAPRPEGRATVAFSKRHDQ